MSRLLGAVILFSAAVVAGFGDIHFSSFISHSSDASNPSGACDIKGNVSYNNGQKIYHMPGQEDYDDTAISPHRGERWFCSEAEARASGWRKAGR